MIEGYATPDGTAAYAERTGGPKGRFRVAQGLTLSTVGMGSYLGQVDATARKSYSDSTLAALSSGLNVIDTASNYRDQASERDVGAGIRAFVDGGGRRSSFLVSTKAGFLHGDCDEADPDAWFAREYIESGILRKSDVRSGHCLAPAYIRHELGRSRRNLGLATIDVMFLHNPEHALEWGLPEAEFLAVMQAAFEELERAVDAGELRMYGIATWDGLRVGPDQQGHLSLVKLVHHAGQARMKVGGKASDHHFRAIQLPVNLAMTQAALSATQGWRFGHATPLEACKDLGVITMASASLMQMRLRGRVPPEYSAALETQDDAQTLLQFTRSVPGVTTALVGCGQAAHAKDAAALAHRLAPAPGTVKTLLGTGSIHGA